MSLKRMALIIGVITLMCGLAFSQSESGTLSGTVVDSSNAAVPGAQISAKDLRTGAVRNTVTTAEGIFVLSSLKVDAVIEVILFDRRKAVQPVRPQHQV